MNSVTQLPPLRLVLDRPVDRDPLLFDEDRVERTDEEPDDERLELRLTVPLLDEERLDRETALLLLIVRDIRDSSEE